MPYCNYYDYYTTRRFILSDQLVYHSEWFSSTVSTKSCRPNVEQSWNICNNSIHRFTIYTLHRVKCACWFLCCNIYVLQCINITLVSLKECVLSNIIINNTIRYRACVYILHLYVCLTPLWMAETVSLFTYECRLYCSAGVQCTFHIPLETFNVN